jgi:hypothetical protein
MTDSGNGLGGANAVAGHARYNVCNKIVATTSVNKLILVIYPQENDGNCARWSRFNPFCRAYINFRDLKLLRWLTPQMEDTGPSP